MEIKTCEIKPTFNFNVICHNLIQLLNSVIVMFWFIVLYQIYSMLWNLLPITFKWNLLSWYWFFLCCGKSAMQKLGQISMHCSENSIEVLQNSNTKQNELLHFIAVFLKSSKWSMICNFQRTYQIMAGYPILLHRDSVFSVSQQYISQHIALYPCPQHCFQT